MLRRILASASIAFALSLFAATVAEAAAQRTFVASNGNDANPCSIVSPCRAFAAAIAQTIDGGEVIVLDSAGYGTVTISQSVSIIAPADVYAGISVPFGQTGVLINGAGVNVVLRGLTVNSTGGSYGIHMTNGAVLTVENCEISNFIVGDGATIETNAIVSIDGSTIRNNAGGVIVGSGATVSITGSRVFRNIFEGIQIVGGITGTTTVSITDTVVTGTGPGGATRCVHNNASGDFGFLYATRVTVTNCNYAVKNEPQGFAIARTLVSNSMVSGNSYGFANVGGVMTVNNDEVTENSYGVSNDGGLLMIVSNSMVSGNGHGFSNAGGTFWSFVNSAVSGNAVDVEGTITNVLPL